METREENVNDLVEALKISSAYRQGQERFWRQQGIRDKRVVPMALNITNAKPTKVNIPS